MDKVSRRNPALEQHVIDAPQNDSCKLVYADWLLTHGDPWGELIMLQNKQPPHVDGLLFQWDDPLGVIHAIRQRPVNKELFAASLGTLSAELPAPNKHDLPREVELRQQFRDELLGDFPNNHVRLGWHCGFVTKVFIPRDRWLEPKRLNEIVARLFEHRTTLALQELAIGAATWNGAQSWCGYNIHYQGIIDICAAAAPPSLQRLVLGAWREQDISWTAIGNLSEVYPALSGLRALELQGNGIDLGAINLPDLTKFLLRSGGLPMDALEAMQHAHWPKLEELTLWFGVEEYGGTDSIAAIEPFLKVQNRTQLRRLGLANTPFSDEVCKRLPNAPVLPQLTHLDLSMGTMTDKGARQLLRSHAKLAHLTHLDVRGNSISAALCDELATLCEHVDTRFQDGRRYVTVSE